MDARRHLAQDALMILHALFALSLSTCPPASPVEQVRMINMIVNGDFSAEAEDVVPGGIPWWILSGNGNRVEAVDGKSWLVTGAGSNVVQPVPAYDLFVDQLVVTGRVRGRGRVSILDGNGDRASLEVGSPGEVNQFVWRGDEIAKVMGHAPIPRLNLALDGMGEDAAWTDIQVFSAFPLPTEEAMRAELVETLHYCLDPWIERSVDRVGPQQTALFCTLFDAITGETIYDAEAGYHPLAGSLMEALQHEPDPAWELALEKYVADFLLLCVHPKTGLPRTWDPLTDRPLDENYLEPALAFGFLLDIHKYGPIRYRGKALAAAQKAAESALKQGAMADGNVAALYRPSDGNASTATRMIRRLDLPAQLTRVAKLGGDTKPLNAARSAVATVLYTHYWPGSWNRIDPGFDDDFGHYAARAQVMAREFPKEPLFRRVIDGGWDRYRVLWRQSLKFGGSMAADQVRCWKLLLAYSKQRPEIRKELGLLLEGAVHSHLRGQQYGSGAWGDVTYSGFQPKVDLEVGDLPGTPSNLLEGLAMVYGTGLGPSDEDLRALFTGILRNSRAVYGREYGLITSMREIDGPNNAGGSIRILPALTLFLSKLDHAR